MDDITDLHCKNIIRGYFNIFFSLTHKAHGGNQKMKKKSVAKFVHIKESLGLCGIWRVRNPKKKRYTFTKQHVTGFTKGRLDYFLVSNNLQESIKKTKILTALSTDLSPIFFSLSKNIGIPRTKGLWKFNNSLCHKPDFITELKNHLKFIYNRVSAGQITDEQLCWEYMKYEIRNFSIRSSKEKAKKMLNETVILGNKLKELIDCIF